MIKLLSHYQLEQSVKKLNLFLSATIIVWGAGVNAHGPVRQKLQESVQINASPEKVWNILKDFGTVDWLPMVKSVDAAGGNTKGATRILTLDDSKTISEKLKKYDTKKMSYSYKITDMTVVDTILHAGQNEPIKVLPVTDYASSIMVKAKGNNAEVIWKAAYYRGYMNNNPPAALNEETARKAIQAVFQAGLENLKLLAESNQSTKSVSKIAVPSSTVDKKQKPVTKEKSATAFDANYPAASFEPKVIYIDKNFAKISAKASMGETSTFDPDYPAANFEPKVIFP